MSSIADQRVDLRPIVEYLWSRRWFIAVVTFAFVAAAVAAALLLTPRYRATAVLVSASHEATGGGLLGALGQLGGLASAAGIGLAGGDEETQEAMAVLQSRQFTEQFLADRNLLPVLFARKWDAAAKTWRGDKHSWPTLADG